MDELTYIAIEGVIGAGKTSLARKISERLCARLILEEFEQNPFLENFYREPEKYAFQTQMFFLISRYKQQEKLSQLDLFSKCSVSDYMFEKDLIFAGLTLSDQELGLYNSIFPLLKKSVRKPDLVVFINSSLDRIMMNIKNRGRDMEKDMSRDYISSLLEAYRNFFKTYKDEKVILINATDLDFVNEEEDFNLIYNKIFNSKL